MLAIEIEDLVKEYRNGVRALDRLSLRVNAGEIFALLGPNGAGKSSLIHILTTYSKPSSGKVTMLGKDLRRAPGEIRRQIACVAQQVSIDSHLSLMENLLFQSRLYKVDAKTAHQRIRTLIDSFGLSPYLRYPTASYSGGVKRRLDLAMNMVSLPRILFLDEPTVGMDVDSRKAMWEMLLRIRDDFGTTIFLTTHYLEEADRLSDTICIMKRGREVARGTPASLRRYTRQNLLRLGFAGAEQARRCQAALEQSGLATSASLRHDSVLVDVADGRTAISAVNRWLLEQRLDFTAIEIVEPSLEDVFLALTGPARQESEA
ncbi:ABC-2 type transport system ATP-binding protein [Hydrogenispora ethanolica]|uniref:ABC-2 type transport system ATP-binding protein n=1 Tax=Hydrogenispora ethanolica TaxID=1082276 RepID=A0A4R1RGV0_HYDET|nr:ABC transporter ATP-binding protein [Hydrogenispora ethanolica]TCL65278.1 ABC-2 type transport system ATP-binding protein [Hydrogenispora ethanolica]